MFTIFLSMSCSTTGVLKFYPTAVHPNESLGAGHENVDNKIFKIRCVSKINVDFDYFVNGCLKYTSKFLDKKDYEYFSIQDVTQDSAERESFDVDVALYGGPDGGSVTAGKVKKHTHYYNFTAIGLKKEDLKNAKSFYKVEDYK